jgi:hypothetical protein
MSHIRQICPTVCRSPTTYYLALPSRPSSMPQQCFLIHLLCSLQLSSFKSNPTTSKYSLWLQKHHALPLANSPHIGASFAIRNRIYVRNYYPYTQKGPTCPQSADDVTQIIWDLHVCLFLASLLFSNFCSTAESVSGKAVCGQHHLTVVPRCRMWTNTYIFHGLTLPFSAFDVK